MKRCTRCGQDRPVDEFRIRTDRQTRQSWCRTCKNAYDRDWYQRNKDKHKREVAKRRKREIQRLRQLVEEIEQQPCADCGRQFPPCVMDFDHVRGTKVEAIGRLTVSGGEPTLRAELAKCDVVCANCHRIRTRNRGYGNGSGRRLESPLPEP